MSNQDTDPGTPLAKLVRSALREGIDNARQELLAELTAIIDKNMGDLELKLTAVLVDSVSPRFMELESRLDLLERRMDHLERRVTPTEPAPPP